VLKSDLSTESLNYVLFDVLKVIFDFSPSVLSLVNENIIVFFFHLTIIDRFIFVCCTDFIQGLFFMTLSSKTFNETSNFIFFSLEVSCLIF